MLHSLSYELRHCHYSDHYPQVYHYSGDGGAQRQERSFVSVKRGEEEIRLHRPLKKIPVDRFAQPEPNG